MALTDNQTATKAVIKTAVASKLEALFTTPDFDDLDSEEQDAIRANWEAMGEAVAEALSDICTHIAANLEIGFGANLVTSDVDGGAATQNNPGTGLVR